MSPLALVTDRLPSCAAALNMLSEIAERTAQGWLEYKDAAFCHVAEMKAMLDKKDPSYAE
jgi:hypothetical protein